MTPLTILLAAAFTLTACYSAGRLPRRPLRAPRVMALPLGAAILGTIVFVLLAMGRADSTTFAVVGAIAIAPLLWRDRRPPLPQKHEPLDRTTAWLVAAIFVPYSVLYFVHALAPELQPDAVGYHLGLVAEYYRLGHFSDRIDFYGIL